MFSVNEPSGFSTSTRPIRSSDVASLPIRSPTSVATLLDSIRFRSVIMLSRSWGRALPANWSPVIGCATTWASPWYDLLAVT